jgi:hypothetical protein
MFLVSQATPIACAPSTWNKGLQMKASVKTEAVMSGGECSSKSQEKFSSHRTDEGFAGV